MQFVSAGNWPDEALTTGNDFNSARMKEDNQPMKRPYAELKAQWYAVNPEDPGAKKFWDHYHPKKRSSNYDKLRKWWNKDSHQKKRGSGEKWE